MSALSGGLGDGGRGGRSIGVSTRKNGRRTSREEVRGDGVPVGGAEVTAAENVPLVLVSVDERHGLILSPAGRRELPRCGSRRIRGRGGGDGGDGDRVSGGGGWGRRVRHRKRRRKER